MSVNASNSVAENTTAGTTAPGAVEHHADPALFGVMTATVWASLAMVVVIVILLWKKVPGAIGASLDKKIAEIRANLDEAASLRADAEKIRAEYEAKAKAAAGEAEQILASARQEADAIVDQARADAAALRAKQEAKTAATLEAEKRVKAIDAELAGKAATADASLKAAQAKAIGEIESVAVEAAREIVATVSGLTVDKAVAEKAVKAALAA